MFDRAYRSRNLRYAVLGRRFGIRNQNYSLIWII